jgi:probable HAF family extracellular repeat protein
MKRFGLTALLFSLLAIPCQAQYKVTTADFPGAAQTNLFAVNNEGQYVGALIEADAGQTNHAIFFDGRTFRQLDPNGVLGTGYSFALSLNLRGDIVGGYFDASWVGHGFLYHDGNVKTIDFPGATITYAFGINDLRQIIGVYWDTAYIRHAFLLEDGVYKNIDLPGGISTVPYSINDWSQIAGKFQDVSGTVGHGYFQMKNGKSTTYDAPGAPPDSTFFISVNNIDRILGAWIDSGGVTHNFVLSAGRLHNFDLPESLHATGVSAQTINDFGEIVGYYTDPQGVQHGFVAIPLDKRGQREFERD